MEIFNFQDYRHYISFQLNTQAKTRGSMSKLAIAMKLKISYLSQVIKGERNLSPEQGFFLAKYFKLSARESEYLQELILLDKASSPEYRTQIQKRLEQIKSARDETLIPEKNQTVFYSSWLYSAVQLCTGISGLQTPESIAHRLGVDSQVIRHALKLLVESGLCSTDGKSFFPLAKKTILAEGSPLMGRHKTNWRMKALDQIPQFREKDMFFTGVVRIDRKSYDKINQSLRNAIREVHQSIEEADDELLACINLDLFQL